MQRLQWKKNGENWKRYWHGSWRKSETKKVRIRSWNHNFRNTKVELHSEAILWEMILDHNAVFTEQGSSASQMTAVKVMDIIPRLPGCSGQGADAVSAYTQVKMIPISECPHIWIRLPKHKWPKSWSSTEDPVVPLERNLYGHPLAGLLCERQFDKVLLQYGWEKVPNWRSFFDNRKRTLLICVCGWHKKWLERNRTLIRCGNYSTKNLIWENQYLSLIMYTWDALKDNVKYAKILWTISEPCLNPEFPPEQLKMLWNYSNFFVVLRYGGSCQEMCGTILWAIKQDDSTTLQRIYSLYRRPPLQGRREEICWRIVTRMLSNCSEMLVLDTYSMKDVDLGEPTSFLDHVYLGCTQTECQMSKDIVNYYKSTFESRISARAMEKLPVAQAPGKPETNTFFSGSYDMEGHAK